MYLRSLIDLGAVPEELDTYNVMHGKGCRTCNNTGYKGRVAVYEIMPMTDERRVCSQQCATPELKEAIVGMLSLRIGISGRSGMTSMAEVHGACSN